MHEFCHRCGGELPAGDGLLPFCPHCGAPQIYLLEHEQAPVGAEGESTGGAPPPRLQQVEWKTAIRCAGLVAGIAGVLSLVAMEAPRLSLLSWLWTISGSLITLALYQKRRPLAWMDASIGARIGMVAGFGLVMGLAVSTAVAGLVARYALHSMGDFDAQLTEQLHTQIEHAVAANPQQSDVLKYLYSPEFRAGMMLAGFAMISGFVLLVSTVGGALGGFLRTRSRASV
jgi:hypothetical protein